jgi:hypothetical protein
MSKKKIKPIWKRKLDDERKVRLYVDCAGVHFEYEYNEYHEPFGISIFWEDLTDELDTYLEVATFPDGPDGRCLRHVLDMRDGEVSQVKREER